MDRLGNSAAKNCDTEAVNVVTVLDDVVDADDANIERIRVNASGEGRSIRGRDLSRSREVVTASKVETENGRIKGIGGVCRRRSGVGPLSRGSGWGSVFELQTEVGATSFFTIGSQSDKSGVESFLSGVRGGIRNSHLEIIAGFIIERGFDVSCVADWARIGDREFDLHLDVGGLNRVVRADLRGFRSVGANIDVTSGVTRANPRFAGAKVGTSAIEQHGSDGKGTKVGCRSVAGDSGRIRCPGGEVRTDGGGEPSEGSSRTNNARGQYHCRDCKSIEMEKSRINEDNRRCFLLRKVPQILVIRKGVGLSLRLRRLFLKLQKFGLD